MIAAGLAATGAEVVVAPVGLSHDDHRVDQLERVAMVCSGGSLRHFDGG